MPGLEDLIGWSGSGAALSLFTVAPSEPEQEPTMRVAGILPHSVSRYEMESDGVAGFRVFEHDAYFDAVPAHLSAYLAACLDEALECGAPVAWFGFEGSFHYGHLLTPDIAAQIYGVADASGIAVVTQASQLDSDGWRRRVAIAKENLPRFV